MEDLNSNATAGVDMRNKERQRLLTMKETFGLATALTFLLIAVEVHAMAELPHAGDSSDAGWQAGSLGPRPPNGRRKVGCLWAVAAKCWRLSAQHYGDCRGKFQTEYGQAARLQDRH